MEKLVLSNLGQWTLVKNWEPKHIGQVEDWAESGIRRHLADLPPAQGKLRESMLKDLSSHQSRIHPETGEKEYKVYRAIKSGDDSHTNRLTSWTIHPHFAAEWSNYAPQPQVLEAWVPEKHVHSYLPTVQTQHNHEKNEGELLVHPHDVNISKTFKGKDLDKFQETHSLKDPSAPPIPKMK